MELIHCQIYMKLNDFSNAMMLVTKTIASLDESNEGNLGKLRLLA